MSVYVVKVMPLFPFSKSVQHKSLVMSRGVKPGQDRSGLSACAKQEPLVAVEPRRPPLTNLGTETAFRHDHCKHFQKSKHLLGSEVSWCDQSLVDLQHRSTCLASRISTQKEPFPRSEFMLALNLDMPDLHRWISKLTASHLQILHQEIFWSPW